MAEFTRRARHIERVEYVLPSGIAWGEAHKAFAAIRSDLGEEEAAGTTPPASRPATTRSSSGTSAR